MTNDRTVAIAGGASPIQRHLAAGAIDGLHLHVVPTLLGAGERLLEEVGHPRLALIDVVASPLITHIRYRVLR